jgi:tRNA pseudouridine(55) synthase
MEKGRIVEIYKHEGETPLVALERFRAEHKELAGHSLTYIGRLDPMAEGVLLLLIDGTQAERELYLGLDKTYRIEVLFGVETDSGDILGLVDKKVELFDCKKDGLEDALQKQVGLFNKPYPHFSSKPVLGKPLFMWAREGKLDQITIPIHDSRIYSIELINVRKISTTALLMEIKQRINKVVGDFRQEEIKTCWEESLKYMSGELLLVEIVVSCGSGTYMRMLASDIGKILAIPALAYRIKRESIGNKKM